MKKTAGILSGDLSLLLVVLLAVNSVSPAMSGTIADIISSQPKAASVNDTSADRTGVQRYLARFEVSYPVGEVITQ